MKLDVQGGLQAHGRAWVDLSRIAAGEVGLRKAGDKVLRTISLGLYSKYVDNPKQWTAFRQAVLTLRDQGRVTASDGQIETLFSTYSTHKRLTQSKAANILADLERIDRSGAEPAVRHSKRLSTSPNALPGARGSVAHGGLDAAAAQLKDKAAGVLRQVGAAPMSALAQQSVRLSGGSDRDFTLVDETASSVDSASAEREAAGRAVLDILRPGRMMNSASIEAGQDALVTYAQDRGVLFGHSAAPMQGTALVDHLNDVLVDMLDPFILAARDDPDNAGRPAIYSIPFGVKAGNGSEDHSIEIAVDYTNRKLLYLDAKGRSIDYAERNYANQQNMGAVLAEFGQQLFGDDWQPQTGILELAQAEQPGVNDCGAFRHTFTRALIDGQSVGDIERSFDANARALMRLEMAQDIEQAFLGDERRVSGPTPSDVLPVAPSESARPALPEGVASGLPASRHLEALLGAAQDVRTRLADQPRIVQRIEAGLVVLMANERERLAPANPANNLPAEDDRVWDRAAVDALFQGAYAWAAPQLREGLAVYVEGGASVEEFLLGLGREGAVAMLDELSLAYIDDEQTSFGLTQALAQFGRAAVDVADDGHCFYRALEYSERGALEATLAPAQRQRDALLGAVGRLDDAQLAALGGDTTLARAYAKLVTGYDERVADSEGWGELTHLQLKALEAGRPVVAVGEGYVQVCTAAGATSRYTDIAAARAAVTGLAAAGPSPLYVVDTGRNHWQGTRAA